MLVLLFALHTRVAYAFLELRKQKEEKDLMNFPVSFSFICRLQILIHHFIRYKISVWGLYVQEWVYYVSASLSLLGLAYAVKNLFYHQQQIKNIMKPIPTSGLLAE